LDLFNNKKKRPSKFQVKKVIHLTSLGPDEVSLIFLKGGNLWRKNVKVVKIVKSVIKKNAKKKKKFLASQFKKKMIMKKLLKKLKKF
jgi:hypothetical protein